MNVKAKKSPSILIVDDSEDSRSYCEIIADMYSAKVIKARDVEEAMGLLAKGVKPDVMMWT